MDFGKVLPGVLDQIDFTLPPIPEKSANVLGGTESEKFRISFGAPVWGAKEWEGKIYPSRTPSARYLEIYSRVFNCIELNPTFYRTPDIAMIERWKSAVPKGFIFYPKIPQEVSHSGDVTLALRVLQNFIAIIRGLDEHLGVSFLQLPPSFTVKDLPFLKAVLGVVPNDFEFAIEFRHPSFFKNHEVIDIVRERLTERKISIVITDTAGRRDVLHQTLTTQKILIRFLGNELHHSDFTRMQAWMDRVETYKMMGAKEVAFFAHHPSFINIPELAQFWVKEWNLKHSNHLLPEIAPPSAPVKEQPQLSLF